MKYYVVKSTKTTEGDLRAPAITAFDTKELAEQTSSGLKRRNDYD